MAQIPEMKAEWYILDDLGVLIIGIIGERVYVMPMSWEEIDARINKLKNKRYDNEKTSHKENR
jgi:hypothetical protein